VKKKKLPSSAIPGEFARVRQGMNLNRTVRILRELKKLSGAEVCRKAGDLDPRTLTALEKGRIKNPSIQTLESVARGLSLSVSELFKEAELRLDQFFYHGSQKGAYQMDFPSAGIKVVSFTPLMKDFFCGKFLIGARKKFDESFLKHSRPIFVSVLVGRVEVNVGGKAMALKEGENLFFNGIFKHAFYNPLERESVLLMVTAPSFLGAS
jgi:transcriptional regulator with XRE-family HTH domain